MERIARAMFSLPVTGCIVKHDIHIIIDNYRIKLTRFSSVEWCYCLQNWIYVRLSRLRASVVVYVMPHKLRRRVGFKPTYNMLNKKWTTSHITSWN